MLMLIDMQIPANLSELWREISARSRDERLCKVMLYIQIRHVFAIIEVSFLNRFAVPATV